MGIKQKVILILCLSLADFFFSWHGIQRGYIWEGNALLAGLFSRSTPVSFAVKNGITLFSLVVLTYLARLKPVLVKRGLNLVLIIYAGVMLLHAGCWLCFITET